ncbi:MAG TPA: aspartate kinase [Thermoplasmata archaeon]|nr:aspartate kinase [Thermoplasmata archaeon]
MAEPWKVAKFGGSCVSDPEMYDRMAKAARADPSRKFVVVSAIAGVTDSLVATLAKPRDEKEIDLFIAELRRLHLGLLPRSPGTPDASVETVEALVTKLERLLYGVVYTEEITARTRDFILSFGERLATQIVAANLAKRGVDARAHEADVIGVVTDDNYGNASALLDETRARLAPFLKRQAQAGHVSVITGFFGLSQEGKTATFGRGGSDYSAAVVAYALKLPTIEIWKDVGGFMSADPKIVPEAFPLAALSYDEAAELSYFGAKVLHPRSVRPAQMCGASIVLKNIYEPDEVGTRIGPDTVDRSGDVKSISYVRDLTTLKVFGTGAGPKESLLSLVATALADAGINVYSAATSQTCIAFLIDADAVSRAKRLLTRLPAGFVERIEASPHASLIGFVGEGLGYAHGVAARIFQAVAERGINVQLISAGASMVAYTFTVDNKDLEGAVRAVHREFFGRGHPRPAFTAAPRSDP